MDDLDRKIINTLQDGIPVCERPYLAVAMQLGITEKELISRLTHLLRKRILTRVGPLYQIERIGGAFTLAALHAPHNIYDRVAMQVNDFPEVAHNYMREHKLNMWFVIATENPSDIKKVINEIEKITGCQVLNFPKSQEYFIELKLVA